MMIFLTFLDFISRLALIAATILSGICLQISYNVELLKVQLNMALGEKLFEESGNVTGFKVTKVHPTEGVTMEVSFTSEIRGIGRFPSGKNMGSGTITQYPHGIVDGSYQGSIMTTTAEDVSSSDQFVWWAHEKIKAVEGGKFKGLTMMTGFTNSQKLSWMNNLIIALDLETNPESRTFKATAYEWK
jgi:hypothetical protein